MSSRRARIHEYYMSPASERSRGPAPGGLLRPLLEGVPKVASAADRYRFRGAQIVDGVVVRLDLNGYSAWARQREVGDRAQVLDTFFSAVMPALDQAGGVYFRDEGDCVVCLFSSYFGLGATYQTVGVFCRQVVAGTYGALTPKACVSLGPLGFFQKAHERGTDDWSAEGEPFVRAARLEQSVSSTQHICYFASEHKQMNGLPGPIARSGQRYHWKVREESTRISGLALTGGWEDVVYETYVPGGGIQE